MAQEQELKGKVALVTGAASGIGRATTELLAEHGASVVASDWHKDELDEAVKTMTSRGLAVQGVAGNVAERADVDRMVAAAASNFGGLDILVNDAGVMDLDQPVGEVEDALWRRVLAVNLDGPMLTMRAAMPHLVKKGGSIVNIASVAGLGGAAAGAAYTASKHALVGLTLNTAWMYAKDKVRCNAIAAGGVNTNIMGSVDASKMSAAGMARASAYYPLMPVSLEPIDIARLVLFLAGDGSRYINGAIIPADGGWRAA